MMSFLAQAAGLFTVPALAGVGAAAVAIPIVIHLMSRFRRRPEPWGAMRFLLEAYRKQRKRMQLERLLLLVVRCLVVLLAGFALAGPVLSGCNQRGGLASLLTGGSQGRVVYIVVDDALSTQTREAGGTRLAGLKREALSVVDELGEGDRAVVVRAGRPPVWVVEEPTADRGALRDAINGIVPRYGRSDIAAALVQAERSMDGLNLRDGNAVVVVLSDFPRSSAYLDETLPPELEGLGRRASVVASLPAQGADNVQVVSVVPRRRMVVASGGGSAEGSSAAVSTELTLRRFGGVTQPLTMDVRIALLDRAGAEVAASTRTARWLAGQPETRVNLDLPATLAGGESSGGRELVVVAELVAASETAGVDALPADDRALAVVTLRERLQVALVDDGSRVNEASGALQPWHYMRAVLAPSGGGGSGGVGAFEVSSLLPTAVNEQSLAVLDAAVVLRPDQVTASGWSALRGFADRGGLVWVWMPGVTSGEATPWAETMTRVFDVPWRVSTEPAVVAESVSPSGTPVDATTRAPEVLQYLAADWREKLGWVSVSRRLPMDAPEEDRWIVMDAGAAALPSADQPVLMAGRGVGSGALLFTATSPDARFTNLVVRPLFSPLVHDTLRGVLGDSGRLPPVVAGDAPDLGRGWRNSGRLSAVAALPGVMGLEETDAQPAEPVSVRTDGDTSQVIEALRVPGVYQGEGPAAEKLLAVNPDPAAGDTQPAPARLEQWLDKVGGAGGWSYLEDKRREQGGALASSGGAADWTWPLLWALLGLVVLEMFLARWFSHATDHDRPTVVGRALGAWTGEGAASPQAETSDAGERGRAA